MFTQSRKLVLLFSPNTYFLDLSKRIWKIKTYKTIILPIVQYVCEAWSLTLREERRLRRFEIRILRFDFIQYFNSFSFSQLSDTYDWHHMHCEGIRVLPQLCLGQTSDWSSVPTSFTIPGIMFALKVPTLQEIEPETSACKAVIQDCVNCLNIRYNSHVIPLSWTRLRQVILAEE